MTDEPGRLPEGTDTDLRVTYTYDGGQSGWSGGTHCCLVEVDVETGLVHIDRYVVVEDCGVPVNPAIVEGQIRGGVAQAIGAVLLEHSAYGEDGQFLAGTFMDYLMPTTTVVPNFEIHHVETVPTDPDVNFRGVGEGGMIVAPACITNAIEDALAPLGVRVREQHLPPARMLELLGHGGGPMKTPHFEYHAPRTVDEVLGLLAEHGDEAKVLAGGQSLVPLLAMRLARPGHLVDLNDVAGLAGITADDGVVAFGATTRERAAESSALVRQRLPVLAEALPQIGHVSIRNRGTIGGSMAHADASAELPAVAVITGAEMVIRSAGQQRSVPAAGVLPRPFHHRPGRRRAAHGGAGADRPGSGRVGVPGDRPPPRRLCHGRRGGHGRPRSRRSGGRSPPVPDRRG